MSEATTTTDSPYAEKNRAEAFIKTLGFTSDKSGWWLRGNMRVVVHHNGTLNLYVTDPALMKQWSARLDGVPQSVIRAIVRSIHEGGLS